jgi:hypothetical protein
MVDPKYTRTYRERGSPFMVHRNTRKFSKNSCRRIFHNRKAIGGVQFYDVVILLRRERQHATELGAWTLFCRLTSTSKGEDDRTSHESWDDSRRIRERSLRVSATVVGTNVPSVIR